MVSRVAKGSRVPETKPKRTWRSPRNNRLRAAFGGLRSTKLVVCCKAGLGVKLDTKLEHYLPRSFNEPSLLSQTPSLR